MIFGQDRTELRKMYADAWHKYCAQLPMSALESQIAAIVEWHPEYHADVTHNDLGRDFTPDGGKTNPFLHMGLHLGIREQVGTDRPTGIATIYKSVLRHTGDAHAAEHQMIEALAETLWDAQSANGTPDEQKYLQRLRHLAGKPL